MIAAVFAALWFAVLVLLVMYVILLGNFGDRALGTMQYPAVILMNNIHLRGGFVKRLDAFMIAIWFLHCLHWWEYSCFMQKRFCINCFPAGKMKKYQKSKKEGWTGKNGGHLEAFWF